MCVSKEPETDVSHFHFQDLPGTWAKGREREIEILGLRSFKNSSPYVKSFWQIEFHLKIQKQKQNKQQNQIKLIALLELGLVTGSQSFPFSPSLACADAVLLPPEGSRDLMASVDNHLKPSPLTSLETTCGYLSNTTFRGKTRGLGKGH